MAIISLIPLYRQRRVILRMRMCMSTHYKVSLFYRFQFSKIACSVVFHDFVVSLNINVAIGKNVAATVTCGNLIQNTGVPF